MELDKQKPTPVITDAGSGGERSRAWPISIGRRLPPPDLVLRVDRMGSWHRRTALIWKEHSE